MSGIVFNNVERDHVSVCKRCAVILQFDDNDVSCACYEHGKYFDCQLAVDEDCFDHPRVLYIECANKHRIQVGNPRNVFFGNGLSALRTFCSHCVNRKCECKF